MRETLPSLCKARTLGCWNFSCWLVLCSLSPRRFAPVVKLRLEGDPCCLIFSSAMLHIKNRVTANFPKGGYSVVPLFPVTLFGSCYSLTIL